MCYFDFIFTYFFIIVFKYSGGPTKCGNRDFPKYYTVKQSDNISGSITFCGKPQPIVSWMIGDQSFNGTVELTKADQHLYTYSFKLRITSDMSGRAISYQATGFRNISGSSLIILKSNCMLGVSFFLNWSLS